MDFWDITKLLFRRWQIALPLLVLSVAITAVTVSQVKPDYVATAYVQLVPPNAGRTEPGAITPEQQNQWIGQGLQTLGNAAIVQVMDQTVFDEFKRRGYSETFTVTMGQSTPLVTFETTGSTKAQAKETTDALVTKFTDSVVKLQRDNGVSNKAIMITTSRLDAGGNVKKSTSKVKRALVAVAAAGLLLTAGTTIGIDAWLRRRRKGEFQGKDAEDTATTSPIHSRGTAGASAGVAGKSNVGGIVNSGDHAIDYQRSAATARVGDTESLRRQALDETTIIVPDAESTVVIPLAAMPPRPASAKRGTNN
ncbi:hypothetical protein [Dactylosporangium sp. NPDC051484]|uniref:hypothetical protein n=1 Tax=Dactylosporangium sp. NPDC051484 TaxID=3154942 RepID=UPI00344D437E